VKKYRAVIVVVALFATLAVSSTIHSWTTGDVLNSNDLNANFSHLHNLMVGGHGARLVNADVSASAAIAHTKMATPALLPKATVIVGANGTPCAAGTCTLRENVGGIISSVTYAAGSQYTVNFPVRSNADYTVLITPQTTDRQCQVMSTTTTTGFTYKCYTAAGVAADAVAGVVLFDQDN
jgi:hypothetical protein